jgi:hypothetical protein
MRITLSRYFSRKIDKFISGEESTTTASVAKTIMRMARSNRTKTVLACNRLLVSLDDARHDARYARDEAAVKSDSDAYARAHAESRFVSHVLQALVAEFRDVVDNYELSEYSAESYFIVNKLQNAIPRSTHSLRDFISAAADCEDSDAAMEWLMDNADIVRCDHCEEWEWAESITGTWDDTRICRQCVDDSFRWSEYYDSYVSESEARNARDEGGNHVLVSEHDDNFCYNEDLDGWAHCNYEHVELVIQSYHSSKRDQRLQHDDWTNTNKRYIGVELEVEVQSGYDREDKASIIHKAVNAGIKGQKVFFESDGSLSHGFEIITQPMSLPAHRQLWQWLQNRSLTKGMKSHQTTTCGLHVHISRSGLSALQIGKIVAFINAPENESLVTAIARRYGQAATGYCRIKDKSKIGNAHRSQDRYEAVNVTPRSTIEFRVFKGTLKYESVIAAIEFANAMVEFSKPYSGYGCNDMKADCFLEFIDKKIPQETKTLRAYVHNRLEIA